MSRNTQSESGISSLQAKAEQTVFYYPPKVYSSERGNEVLYFAPDQQVVVVVNLAGQDVLKAAEEGGTADEIALRLSRGDRELGGGIQQLVRPFLDEMVKRRFLSKEPFANEREGRPSPERASLELSNLYLHLTDACNLHCVYCYNACQRTENIAQRRSGAKGIRELSDEEIREVLDDAAEEGIGTVVFTGGEPLLRNHIFNLADYAREKGISASLLTNGTLIDREKAVRIADLFDNVIVSLDSWIEAEYATLRPGAPLHQVWDGVRHLSEAGVQSLAIRPVVTSLNLASLPDFPSIAKEQLNCTRFYPAVYLPNSPGELETLGLFPDPETYWSTLASFFKALDEVDGTSVKDECKLSGAGACGAATSLLSISASGDVYPCQSLHLDEFWAGNVRKQSLGEILQDSPALKAFRENRWPWFKPCSECSLMAICSSTCRVFQNVFEKRQDLFFQQMCPFFKRECEHRLWREVDKIRLQFVSSGTPLSRG